jgi:dTDP-4-amino-4,6-dideoxygalactose transaminase
MGNALHEFEARFADYCGITFCVGVGNGTDALEIALRALNMGPGAQVVTAANAGMYSSTAIRLAGAIPMYADVDPNTLTLDEVAVRKAITSRTGAIIVTHLYGRLANMDGVLRAAQEASVPVIEDCAQAHGATDGAKKAGAFGLVGCFSFYPTKNLGALGDGGAIVTGNLELAERIRKLRQYGWEQKYVVDLVGGRNSRLDELQAAILTVKLAMLDGWNRRRREIARAYSSEIHHPYIRVPEIDDDRYVAHLYVVRSPFRASLRRHLASNGIGSDVHYPVPDHRQPAYRGLFTELDLPHTEAAADEVLSLPCFPEMTDEEITNVVAVCNAWTN